MSVKKQQPLKRKQNRSKKNGLPSDPEPQAAWIRVGTVGKAHGLRGHFFVSQRTDPLPKDCKVLLAGEPQDDQTVQLNIAEVRYQNDRIVVRCEEVVDRNGADAIRGRSLWMPRAQVGLAHDQGILWGELIGKVVVDAHGDELGTVAAVNNFGAHDVITLKQSKWARQLNIPLIPEYVDLDIKSGDEPIKLVVDQGVFSEFWTE